MSAATWLSTLYFSMTILNTMYPYCNGFMFQLLVYIVQFLSVNVYNRNIIFLLLYDILERDNRKDP
jgi:hypothetical protein